MPDTAELITDIRWMGRDEGYVQSVRKVPDGWRYETVVTDRDLATGADVDHEAGPLATHLGSRWPWGCIGVEVDGVTAEVPEYFSTLIRDQYELDEGFGLNGRWCAWNGQRFEVEQWRLSSGVDAAGRRRGMLIACIPAQAGPVPHGGHQVPPRTPGRDEDQHA